MGGGIILLPYRVLAVLSVVWLNPPVSGALLTTKEPLLSSLSLLSCQPKWNRRKFVQNGWGLRPNTSRFDTCNELQLRWPSFSLDMTKLLQTSLTIDELRESE